MQKNIGNELLDSLENLVIVVAIIFIIVGFVYWQYDLFTRVLP